MLEKTAIADTTLHAALRNALNLAVQQIEFLPLGAHPNTAVYRATTAEGAAFFVKLRTGAFDAITICATTFKPAVRLHGLMPRVVSFPEMFQQQLIDRLGFFVLHPMTCFFQENQAAVVAQVDARLRQRAAERTILRTPDHQRRHSDASQRNALPLETHRCAIPV